MSGPRPRTDRDLLAAITDFDQQVAAGRAALDGVTDDPESLFDDESLFAEADALAAEIGLTECTSEG